jgi:enoyl-CoA hydratase
MIRTAVDGSVRVVTLARPDRRNALTPDALGALDDVLETASEPVVYLQGTGEAFCAGADLETVRSLDREAAIAFARQGQAVARALETYDGAVVAGIDGAARGGGVELALACDVRVATPDATLAESGVSLGLFGAWGGTARLPDVVGEGHALDIALSGRVVDADEAVAMGLVSRVLDEPRTVADEIATHDSRALDVLKTRIRDRGSRARQEEREALAFGDLVESLDAIE